MHIVIILQIAIAHCVRRMPFLPYRISQTNADAFIALANEQKHADAILQCANRVRMQLFIYCIAH